MARIVKIVLDTAPFHPLHNMWVKLSESIAKELGVELEIKKEDYMYAITHGETDDLGMAWLPQLFAVTSDGKVELLLSRFPFDPVTTKPDEDEARRQVLQRIKEIESS
jgi:hypothetical protein